MPQTAVITGASAGIGLSFARRLARDGYDLLLIARRLERLDAIASELQNLGRTVEVLAADLATDDGVAAVEKRLEVLPDLALLVNNAGFGVAGRFVDVPAVEHERMHRLHVLATLRLTHAALRRMLPISRGAIINVSSVAGFSPSGGSVSYSATKNWMNAFTEGIWLELRARGSGVTVQALCPGFTYSEFHDVMQMDRSAIPRAWWTDADDVVSASLDGLAKRKLFVVPGWRYKVLVSAGQVLPRGLVRTVSGWLARNYRDRATHLARKGPNGGPRYT